MSKISPQKIADRYLANQARSAAPWWQKGEQEFELVDSKGRKSKMKGSWKDVSKKAQKAGQKVRAVQGPGHGSWTVISESGKLAAGNIRDNRGNVFGPRRGLEGPFKFQQGRVLYYDKREQGGRYYDPLTDMYLDVNQDPNKYASKTKEASPTSLAMEFLYGGRGVPLNRKVLRQIEQDMRKAGDEQSAKLLRDIQREMVEQLAPSAGFERAYNRLAGLASRGGSWDPSLIRNNIFKIANELGMSLPSGMF